MLVRLEQPKNACSPIEVTLSGIVMLVRLEQPKNASSPIEVTPSGIITSALSPLYSLRQPSTISKSGSISGFLGSSFGVTLLGALVAFFSPVKVAVCSCSACFMLFFFFSSSRLFWSSSWRFWFSSFWRASVSCCFLLSSCWRFSSSSSFLFSSFWRRSSSFFCISSSLVSTFFSSARIFLIEFNTSP